MEYREQDVYDKPDFSEGETHDLNGQLIRWKQLPDGNIEIEEVTPEMSEPPQEPTYDSPRGPVELRVSGLAEDIGTLLGHFNSPALAESAVVTAPTYMPALAPQPSFEDYAPMQYAPEPTRAYAHVDVDDVADDESDNWQGDFDDTPYDAPSRPQIDWEDDEKPASQTKSNESQEKQGSKGRWRKRIAGGLVLALFFGTAADVWHANTEAVAATAGCRGSWLSLTPFRIGEIACDTISYFPALVPWNSYSETGHTATKSHTPAKKEEKK